MKKIIYISISLLFVFACNVDDSKKVSADNSADIFNKNCETVRAYIKAFCEENIDYDQFYAENAIIKGTTVGAKDTMNVEDRKIAHKEMWKKYDFSTSEPINILPGVSPETKEMDGSARMYTNLKVTLTENQNTVIIPMYESYDFDENGKILFYQYYGDFTAAILSLEEE